MADITSDDTVEGLKPTAAEAAAISEMKLPRFVDRKNVLVVTDELTGERGVTIQQELPAYLRRKNVKQYTVQPAQRHVGRREIREVNRRAKSLCYRTRVKKGETIQLLGPQGQKMFFKVIRHGWFHAGYYDVKGKRVISIAQGQGAAVVEADLELYEGFREV